MSLLINDIYLIADAVVLFSTHGVYVLCNHNLNDQSDQYSCENDMHSLLTIL